MDREPSDISRVKQKINMYENTRLRLVFRHIALEVPDPRRVRQVRPGRRRAVKHVFTRDAASCVRAITDCRSRRAAGTAARTRAARAEDDCLHRTTAARSPPCPCGVRPRGRRVSRGGRFLCPCCRPCSHTTLLEETFWIITVPILSHSPLLWAQPQTRGWDSGF